MDSQRINQEKALRGQYFRLRQGLALRQERQVEHLEGDTYRVREGGEPQTVRLFEQGCECSCPDFSKYHRPCKHVVAACSFAQSGPPSFADNREKWARWSASWGAGLVGTMEGFLFKTKALKLAGEFLVLAVLVSVMGVALAMTANFLADSVGISTENGLLLLMVLLFAFSGLLLFGGGRKRRRR